MKRREGSACKARSFLRPAQSLETNKSKAQGTICLFTCCFCRNACLSCRLPVGLQPTESNLPTTADQASSRQRVALAPPHYYYYFILGRLTLFGPGSSSSNSGGIPRSQSVKFTAKRWAEGKAVSRAPALELAILAAGKNRIRCRRLNIVVVVVWRKASERGPKSNSDRASSADKDAQINADLSSTVSRAEPLLSEVKQNKN